MLDNIQYWTKHTNRTKSVHFDDTFCYFNVCVMKYSIEHLEIWSSNRQYMLIYRACLRHNAGTSRLFTHAVLGEMWRMFSRIKDAFAMSSHLTCRNTRFLHSTQIEEKKRNIFKYIFRTVFPFPVFAFFITHRNQFDNWAPFNYIYWQCWKFVWAVSLWVPILNVNVQLDC